MDYKIYTTILATRLKKVLINVIHEDQAGFLPKSYLRQNVRNLINFLEYYEAHPEKSIALCFIDTEKAFGNINWNLMIF